MVLFVRFKNQHLVVRFSVIVADRNLRVEFMLPNSNNCTATKVLSQRCKVYGNLHRYLTWKIRVFITFCSRILRISNRLH